MLIEEVPSEIQSNPTYPPATYVWGSIEHGNVLCEKNHITVHSDQKVAIFGRLGTSDK